MAMSEYENRNKQPAPKDTYQEHDVESRVPMWDAVPRNPREGETEEWIDTRRWIEVGRGYRGGVEYAKLLHVMDEGHLEKDVPVARLQELARERREQRLASQGTAKIVKVASDPIPEPVHPRREYTDEEKLDWARPRSEILAMIRADELAEQGRRDSGADIGTPKIEHESSIDPFEELPQNVKDEVLAYRRVLQNKRESERDKNFALAAEDGRAIYRVKQSLSKEAKQFLGLE